MRPRSSTKRSGCERARFNGAEREGAGLWQVTIKDGVRARAGAGGKLQRRGGAVGEDEPRLPARAAGEGGIGELADGDLVQVLRDMVVGSPVVNLTVRGDDAAFDFAYQRTYVYDNAIIQPGDKLYLPPEKRVKIW